jgi:hypothetical protein
MPIQFTQNSDTEKGFFNFEVIATLPVHQAIKRLIPVPLAPDTFDILVRNITGNIGFMFTNQTAVALNNVNIYIYEAIVDSANAVIRTQPIPTLVLPITITPGITALRGPYPIFTEGVLIQLSMVGAADTVEVYINRW